MESTLRGVLEVLKLSEKLKMELRHSWLSNGRQESVAEHTWRMSLMAVLIEPHLAHTIDIAKTLTMIIIHDLVEAEAGDIPAFDTMNNGDLRALKARNEKQAIANIRDTLGGAAGQNLFDLWHEFEEKLTYEARVANALDKLEVQLQHNHADIDTWLEIEHKMLFMIDKHVDFDPTLEALKDLIVKEGDDKLKRAGILSSVENP